MNARTHSECRAFICVNTANVFDLQAASRDDNKDKMKIKYARRKPLPRKTKTVKCAELVITKTESTLKLDVDKEDTGQRHANALELNIAIKEEQEVLAISEQQHFSTTSSCNDSDTVTSKAAQSAEQNSNNIKQESSSELQIDITSALVKEEPESNAEKESGSQQLQEDAQDAENDQNTDRAEDGEGRNLFSQ